MISRIIETCARNRFLVFSITVFLIFAGVWSLDHIPFDALPDISDVEVIVHTHWSGEPPSVMEDQVTYPIVTSLLAAPRVQSVRAQTMPGDSYVYAVFQDGTNLYWARSRILEYLERIQGRLPEGVHPVIGPDATGAGWIYEYALVDKSHRLSLADLRTLQDWTLRYALETVPGVAEIATIGGYVRQYQVRLDPNKLLAYGIPLARVMDQVKASAKESGGRELDLNGARYIIRGIGYFHSLEDLATVPVGSKDGVPVLVRDLGTVAFGPDIRDGAAEWNGEGETVGGIVVMRQGMNALKVIRGVKQKMREIAPSLPPGVEIMSGYDRSGLIQSSIRTLRRDLIEEVVIVSLIVGIFLLHFRSAFIAILVLPIAVVVSFIPMHYLDVSSNIMSLGGLALAIGVLVDASIVMVENGYRRLSERQARDATPVSESERRRILIDAAVQVGPAIFVSLLIIVVSFLPVFLLQAQEGRMFRPLAWTKTLAVACSSILAMTLVPALMVTFIRGHLKPEKESPISRITQAAYLPVLRFCLHHRWLVIGVNLAFLAATLPIAFHLGSQFMPPLYEGSALYMPMALPGISIGQAKAILGEQDRILRGFPEVASVFGTVGRSDSATDNAPLNMFDTTLMLKPRDRWPAGMTYPKLIAEMNAKLRFPGISNTWTMPVENRLDMELTGIRTPLGIKVQGPTIPGISAAAERIQSILSRMSRVRSVFAEKADQGFYLDVNIDRGQAARYGLTMADIDRAISSGIGGEDVAENIEGRSRFPINVRYARDFRNNLSKLQSVLVATPSAAQIPLGRVASFHFAKGPSMIRDEDGALTGYIYIDLKDTNYGQFVKTADQELGEKLKLPAGYTYQWSGEYRFEQRANRRLEIILPVVFFLIFVFLYFLFHSVGEALVLIFPTFYAFTGGMLLQWFLHFHFSVATAVGYIALFGIAVETGIVMVIYLREALDARSEARMGAGEELNKADIEAAVIEGAVLRLRPKLMTVAAVLLSLIPILWETGIGSDVMKPIAAPIVGGMVTSSIHVLILVPVLFAMMKERELTRGRLRKKAAG